jgi:hypothetical protein
MGLPGDSQIDKERHGFGGQMQRRFCRRSIDLWIAETK